MNERRTDTQGREWVRWTDAELPIKPWMHAVEPGASSLVLFCVDPDEE